MLRTYVPTHQPNWNEKCQQKSHQLPTVSLNIKHFFSYFSCFFFISSFFSCSNLTLFAFSFSLALWFFCDNKKQAENIPLIACVMKECHARGVHIVNDFSLALLVWIVDLFRWCRGCCQRPGTGFNVVFPFCLFPKVEFTTKTQYTTCLQS